MITKRKGNFNIKVDEVNKFIIIFDTRTGWTLRTNVMTKSFINTFLFSLNFVENESDVTKIINILMDKHQKNDEDVLDEPFMAEFPDLIDVGVMGHCINGISGKCLAGKVQCYQNGKNTQTPNMTLVNFQKIVDECKDKTNQFALGGRGDVNQHEEFEEIVKYCRENGIIPNYTTSGLDLTEEQVRITKEYCGSVAVSEYRQEHTRRAIRMMVDAGISTNIHYVLSNDTIDEAIEKIETNGFDEGINAVIFLTHKPVGLGTQENVLEYDDPKVKKFFKVIDESLGKLSFDIGFDSCTVPGLLNLTERIDKDSMDTCEGGRFSMYITADMKALPCSFDNQKLKYAYDIQNDTIQSAWNSPQFNKFRDSFTNSCTNCPSKKREQCLGGCPIVPEIVLCNSKDKELYHE